MSLAAGISECTTRFGGLGHHQVRGEVEQPAEHRKMKKRERVGGGEKSHVITFGAPEAAPG